VLVYIYTIHVSTIDPVASDLHMLHVFYTVHCVALTPWEAPLPRVCVCVCVCGRVCVRASHVITDTKQHHCVWDILRTACVYLDRAFELVRRTASVLYQAL